VLSINFGKSFEPFPGTCQVNVTQTNENGQSMTVDSYEVFGGELSREFRSGFFGFSAICDEGFHGHTSSALISTGQSVVILVTFCGDGFCLPETETFTSCPQDCIPPSTGTTGTTGSTGTTGIFLHFFTLLIYDASEHPVLSACNVNITDSLNGQLVQTFNVTGGAHEGQLEEGFYNFDVFCPENGASGFVDDYALFFAENNVPVFVTYCGDEFCSPPENQNNCPQDCGEPGCCQNRICGTDPNCDRVCGLCPYDSFCTTSGNCSVEWTQIEVYSDSCPDVTPRQDNVLCLSGPNVFHSETFQSSLRSGIEVVVFPGFYCGGFSLGVEGVRLTAADQPPVIVPCNPQWWAPAPPSCGGITTPPCWLANNLITVKAHSVVIDGFEFNGTVPNPLFNATSVHNISPYGEVFVGAARGIANWEAGPNRTKIVYPVVTVIFRNSFFYFLEDSGVDLIDSTGMLKGNRFARMGADSLMARRRRQGHTERDRGSRKSGRKAVGSSMDGSSGDVSDNDYSDCDYGGMDGGDYPPGTFPFTKRQDPNFSGRQYDYHTTNWQRNRFSNTLYGGLILENTRAKQVSVSSNVVTDTRRGLIVEAVQPNFGFSVTFSDNTVQVENPLWVWATHGAQFSRDSYKPYDTAVQIVNCNPYELQAPSASSSILATSVNISSAITAYLLKDEPADNTHCPNANRPFVTLSASEGWISNAHIGLRTIGSQVSATNVSIFTEDVDIKIERDPNQLGQIASAQQLPADCPPSCNSHGTCAGINICQCNPGYHDADCHLEVCGDNVCTASENLDNCFSDCDVAVVPPECSHHRGFNESTINIVLITSAINKQLAKLGSLRSELETVQDTIPAFVDTCCTPSSAVEYPLSEVSVSEFSTASYAFYQRLLQFNQDIQTFYDFMLD